VHGGHALPGTRRKKPKRSNIESRGASDLAVSSIAQAVRGLTRAQRHLADEAQQRRAALEGRELSPGGAAQSAVLTRGAIHIPALLHSHSSLGSAARSAMSDRMHNEVLSPSSVALSSAGSTGRLWASVPSPLSTRMSAQTPSQEDGTSLLGQADISKAAATSKSARRSSLRSIAEREAYETLQAPQSPPAALAHGPSVLNGSAAGRFAWLQTQMAAREAEIEEVTCVNG
jgi:hypothetical protein